MSQGCDVKCDGGAVMECAPGERSCITGRNAVQECASSGKWETAEECGDRKSCEEGVCEPLPPECSPQAARCEEDGKRTACGEDGFWSESPCEAVEVCVGEGECKPVVCEPATDYCVEGGTAVAACDATGTGWEEPRPCAEREICMEGKCITLCEHEAGRHSYIGCEYWALDLDNYVNPYEPEEPPFAITVANPHHEFTAQVTLNDPAGEIASFAVGPGEVEVVRLPRDHKLEGSILAPRSYRITSDLPVAAYQFNPLIHEDDMGSVVLSSADASLLMPVPTLTGNFVVPFLKI